MQEQAMTGRVTKWPKRQSAADAPGFGTRRPLLSPVRLVAALRTEGYDLPAGAAGTIVEVRRDGAAYVVEFFAPFHCVATVRDGAFEPT
jgi:hypothetical protein